jgi:pimeloyl-ACP methyl ester carboxylesterase
MTFPVSEHTLKTGRHTTGYLACGAEAAPLLIFCHGWPELSLSWRHQLPSMAALGFRCIAPDMRGYGRSSTYERHEDFAQELIVEDMRELLASLGRDKAVWIGHDWGSPVVWNLAAHHPDKTAGVASLCVPYLASGFTLETVVPLVDRKTYPEAEFPAGQWDYQFFYEESFDKACKGFESNIRNVVKALFRKGDPKAVGKPSRTASVRCRGRSCRCASCAAASPRSRRRSTCASDSRGRSSSHDTGARRSRSTTGAARIWIAPDTTRARRRPSCSAERPSASGACRPSASAR